ncbi:MAG TPA: hypothetical protein VHC22_02150 [Pirellulales bacterium]|nr:hypothetical protein [Pirellulales bacterium]
MVQSIGSTPSPAAITTTLLQAGTALQGQSTAETQAIDDSLELSQQALAASLQIEGGG